MVFQIPKKRRRRRRFPLPSARALQSAQPGPAGAGAAAGRPLPPASVKPRTHVPPGPRLAPCSSSASRNPTPTSWNTVCGKRWCEAPEDRQLVGTCEGSCVWVQLGELCTGCGCSRRGAALSRVPSATSTPGAECRRRYLETDELTAASAG